MNEVAFWIRVGFEDRLQCHPGWESASPSLADLTVLLSTAAVAGFESDSDRGDYLSNPHRFDALGCAQGSWAGIFKLMVELNLRFTYTDTARAAAQAWFDPPVVPLRLEFRHGCSTIIIFPWFLHCEVHCIVDTPGKTANNT